MFNSGYSVHSAYFPSRSTNSLLRAPWLLHVPWSNYSVAAVKKNRRITNIKIWKCQNAKMSKCENAKMPKYRNANMSKCQTDEKLPRRNTPWQKYSVGIRRGLDLLISCRGCSAGSLGPRGGQRISEVVCVFAIVVHHTLRPQAWRSWSAQNSLLCFHDVIPRDTIFS